MTPGLRTSEFKVAVLTVIAAVLSAAQNYITDSTATKLSVAGAIAYIVSRGLAKTEPGSREMGGPRWKRYPRDIDGAWHAIDDLRDIVEELRLHNRFLARFVQLALALAALGTAIAAVVTR